MIAYLTLSITVCTASLIDAETTFDRISNLVTSAGFTVRHTPHPGPSDLPFFMEAQGVDRTKVIDLSLAAIQVPDASTKVTIVRRMGYGSGGRSPEGSLSGKTLGEHCRHEILERLWGLNVVADRYQLQVSIVTSKEAPAGVNPAQRRAFAEEFCERIARVLLADAMALDLDDEGRAQATANLTGCETNKHGFTTLARWAQERSVTVSYEENTASASFTRNGKSVKLYLASDRAVVNGQEVTLGGKFVMARGSRWFVPSAELDAATR